MAAHKPVPAVYEWKASRKLLPPDSANTTQHVQQAKEREQTMQAARKCVTLLCAQVVEFVYYVAHARWHQYEPGWC